MFSLSTALFMLIGGAFVFILDKYFSHIFTGDPLNKFVKKVLPPARIITIIALILILPTHLAFYPPNTWFNAVLFFIGTLFFFFGINLRTKFYKRQLNT